METIFFLSALASALSPRGWQRRRALLAEADRRMYLEKQKQPVQKDKRLHTRVKCRLTIELYAQSSGDPVFGNLVDLSLGGCYVETSALFTPGSTIKLVFSIDDGTLLAEGTVARIHPGSGVAVQFREMSRESREKMHRILDFVQTSTTVYNDRYLQTLSKR